MSTKDMLDRALEAETELAVMTAMYEALGRELADARAQLREGRAEEAAMMVAMETRIVAKIVAQIAANREVPEMKMPEMPEAPEQVDLAPLAADLATIKNMLGAMMMAEPKEEVDFVIERYPIPPGSMLPYGPVKTIRTVPKGKA